MKDIRQTWFFEQPVREVWDYLTQPELIEQWLMKTNFKPVVGHQFKFESDGGNCSTNTPGVASCKVLQVVANKLLSYSWRNERGNGSAAVESVVTWTLAEKKGGTELLLQHNGFVLLNDYTLHNDGWSTHLQRLENLLTVQL